MIRAVGTIPSPGEKVPPKGADVEFGGQPYVKYMFQTF